MNFDNKEGFKPEEYSFETTTVFGNTYNVDMLFDYAETIPTEEVSLSKLEHAVSKGNYYWTDKKGRKLSPFDLLNDWSAAQSNSDWSDHVNNVKNADLQWPLWVTTDGQIFNGMHRLTRYFLDEVTPVRIKIFDSLPDEALVK